MYSIKAIASLTGLTPETLRAWERRYDCVTPQRNANGRRSYSQQDLEKLKLLTSLTRNGHAISKIAHLSCEQLQGFQSQSAEAVDLQKTDLFNQIIDALLHYRIERCEQLLKRALLAYEPLNYAKEILLPSLHRVGQLWHEQKLNTAQEHMLSSCIKRIVLTMINDLHHPSPNNPSILFATPCGERHEFGILLGCLIAASQQYTCYYLGADLPAPDIIDACHHLKPDIIMLGMVNSPLETPTLKHLNKMLAFAESTQSLIWLAGTGAVDWLRQHPSPSNICKLITDIEHFHTQIQQQHFFK